MHPKDVDGTSNSVGSDKTAPLAVWSESALFAQNYLSYHLEFLW